MEVMNSMLKKKKKKNSKADSFGASFSSMGFQVAKI